MSIKRQIDWALDLVHIDYSTAPILNSAKLFGCFFYFGCLYGYSRYNSE